MSATPKVETPAPETTGKPSKAVAMDPEIAERVQVAVTAAVDKKAEDLKVLHLGAVTHFTEFFLLASGRNERQVAAITDAVLEELRKTKVRPLHVEGAGKGQWVLLDFGDFVCHIFDEERRAYYALERLWSDAPDVTAKFVTRAGDGSTTTETVAAAETVQET
jgi:ribosome-associated protein